MCFIIYFFHHCVFVMIVCLFFIGVYCVHYCFCYSSLIIVSIIGFVFYHQLYECYCVLYSSLSVITLCLFIVSFASSFQSFTVCLPPPAVIDLISGLPSQYSLPLLHDQCPASWPSTRTGFESSSTLLAQTQHLFFSTTPDFAGTTWTSYLVC